MTDLNTVTLIGRLTRDVEVAYTKSGMAAGKMSLAVNRSVKKGEKWEDEANFFECSIFGKMAEVLKDYLLKGKKVAIVGNLRQERWEKDGKNFSKVTVVVNQIELIDGGKSEAREETSYQQRPQAVQAVADAFGGDFTEDVPF